MDVSEIEKRVDRAITSSIQVKAHLGGLDPENYGQVMEFAKTMATCRAGIPKWLRGSIGDCLMICTRALRWGMDPFFVAEKSYLMVNKSGEERIGYESQLIHAVIEALAPIKGRLRHEIKGEGDDRCCVVWGTFKGEDTPHTHTSETLGKRIKDIGKSEKGNFRGSPLWLQKPTVQMFYDTSRDWARVNCPEVLAGVYTRDELTDHEMVDVTPAKTKIEELSQRLRDRKHEHAQGFDAGHVEREAAARSSIIEETAQQEKTDEPTKDRSNADDDKERGDGVHDRSDDPAHQSGDAGGVGGDAAAVAEHAGSPGAREEDDQSEIFPPDRRPSKGKRK